MESPDPGLGSGNHSCTNTHTHTLLHIEINFQHKNMYKMQCIQSNHSLQTDNNYQGILISGVIISGVLISGVLISGVIISGVPIAGVPISGVPLYTCTSPTVITCTALATRKHLCSHFLLRPTMCSAPYSLYTGSHI